MELLFPKTNWQEVKTVIFWPDTDKRRGCGGKEFSESVYYLFSGSAPKNIAPQARNSSCY